MDTSFNAEAPVRHVLSKNIEVNKSVVYAICASPFKLDNNDNNNKTRDGKENGGENETIYICLPGVTVAVKVPQYS